MKNKVFFIFMLLIFALRMDANPFFMDDGASVQIIFPKNGNTTLIIDFDNGNKDFSFELPSNNLIVELTFKDAKDNQTVYSITLSQEYTPLPNFKHGEYLLSIKVGSKVYQELVLF